MFWPGPRLLIGNAFSYAQRPCYTHKRRRTRRESLYRPGLRENVPEGIFLYTSSILYGALAWMGYTL